MNKETFDKELLIPLKEQDDIETLKKFDQFQLIEMDLYQKIEWTHEFLDQLSSKLKESKSSMNKEELSSYIFAFIQKTIREYDYNPKFVSQQCKTLVTYYKNQKDLEKVIEVLEFLIQNGIVEDAEQGFHIQLDKVYRLHQKKQNNRDS